MKGIILAAGRGSRMNAATADKPKCMTVLAGKPLLQWQLEALCEAGIDEIAVVCGYKADVIAAAPWPVKFQQIINPRWESTNMVSSLLCACDWAKDGCGKKDESATCIVSYSDIVYAPNHVTRLAESGFPVAITFDTIWQALWEARFEDPLADAETFRQENGRLLEIGKRAQAIEDIQGQYMGLTKLTPAGWQAVERVCVALGGAVDKTDMTTLINRLLESGAPVGAVAVNGQWCEVDNQNDLTVYEKALRTPNWAHDWRNPR